MKNLSIVHCVHWDKRLCIYKKGGGGVHQAAEDPIWRSAPTPKPNTGCATEYNATTWFSAKEICLAPKAYGPVNIEPVRDQRRLHINT